MILSWGLLVLTLSWLPKSAAAFTSIGRRCELPVTTLHALKSKADKIIKSPPYKPGSMMAVTLETGRVPYGEESRKYRRTIFTYDDWVRHRNSERVRTNLRGMLFSGVVRQLRPEVALVSGVATTVLIWNGLVVPNAPVALPLLSMPALPFMLSSPALGLLLVFRTNASYSRWMEARTTWARVVSQCRNIARMAASLADLSDPATREALDQLQLSTWLFARTLMYELSGPPDKEDYEREVLETCEEKNSALARRILDSPSPNMSALAQLSVALQTVPMEEKARIETDKSIILLGDCTSICEKIYSWPVPLVYTRHTARFLGLYMLLLPLALYEALITFADTQKSPIFHGITVVPISAIVAIFLFGIEELAFQLEEPFSIMPLQELCNDIKQGTKNITQWCVDGLESKYSMK